MLEWMHRGIIVLVVQKKGGEDEEKIHQTDKHSISMAIQQVEQGSVALQWPNARIVIGQYRWTGEHADYSRSTLPLGAISLGKWNVHGKLAASTRPWHRSMLSGFHWRVCWHWAQPRCAHSVEHVDHLCKQTSLYFIGQVQQLSRKLCSQIPFP